MRRSRIGGDAVPHRRDAEEHGRAGSGGTGVGVRGRGDGVDQSPAPSQGTQDPQDQPVDMEQRKAMRQSVVGGPQPRIGECVETLGDALPGDRNTFGEAGRAGGIEDQCGRIGVRFRVTAHEPIVVNQSEDKAADTLAGIQAANRFVEDRVKEHPVDWFWVHKRWPDKVYAALDREASDPRRWGPA